MYYRLFSFWLFDLYLEREIVRCRIGSRYFRFTHPSIALRRIRARLYMMRHNAIRSLVWRGSAIAHLCGLRFVNTYRVFRCWGGSEEGGWWYDAGQPLETRLVWGEERARATQERLVAELEGQQPRYHRSSVLGDDGDLEVYVQRHPAYRFPLDAPHYE